MINNEQKTIVITGGTGGIGKAAAEAFAAQGHRLIVIGREEDNAQQAIEDIVSKCANNGEMSYVLGDLSTVSGIEAIVSDLEKRVEKVDVLLNNAGGLFPKRQETADGFESHLAMNHLMPALLSHRLQPLLKAAGELRVVFTSSLAHRYTDVFWDDIQSKNRYYGYQVYMHTKLMHLLWNYAIADDWMRHGIAVLAADPGSARTGMSSNLSFNLLPPYLFFMIPVMRWVTRGKPEVAAETLVAAATDAQFRGQTALYIKNSRPIRSSKRSYDKTAQERVREITAALIGV